MLLIVSRDQHALFEYFRWGFASTDVQVIQDRRQWTRRQRGSVEASAADQKRRQADRRRLPQVRSELVARGFVIAR